MSRVRTDEKTKRRHATEKPTRTQTHAHTHTHTHTHTHKQTHTHTCVTEMTHVVSPIVLVTAWKSLEGSAVMS